MAQFLRMGEEKYGETRLQVITDIDDTVKSSGGLRLLGKLGVNIGCIFTHRIRAHVFIPFFAAELGCRAYHLLPRMHLASRSNTHESKASKQS